MSTYISNGCICVTVPDLNKAEKFYSGVMGLDLLTKNDKQLIYNTIHFTLFVEKNEEGNPPVPSFNVDDIKEAKSELANAGCCIVKEGKKWMWFKDPFGNVFDVIEQD
jgi:catechol 2,3-dioxygenase-like lactoylglutathione lyase family enzyme